MRSGCMTDREVRLEGWTAIDTSMVLGGKLEGSIPRRFMTDRDGRLAELMGIGSMTVLVNRWGELMAKRKSRKLVHEKCGMIPDMIPIHQRPPEVADRLVPGHWEGDLIIGKAHKSAVGTLVERTTRFLLIVRLQGKDAESVRKAFAKAMKQLPESLTLSLTYDRGKEMAEHKKFTMDTQIKVYFCDPHSPWQRGTNENTNGLVRDFWPKGTDFSKIPTKQIVWVQNALNDRPRQTLNWETPRERMNKLISRQAETEG